MKSKTTLLLVIIGLGVLISLAFYISIEIQESRKAKNGIIGNVVLGPECEAAGGEGNCPDNHFDTKIHIFSLSDGKRDLVRSVDTDDDGNFSVNLFPGLYIVRPVGGNPFPACYEQEINVFNSEFSEVVLNCDTGIR